MPSARRTIPKVETYDGLLYVVLHGINFHASEHAFDTHDTDFFLSARFLVTVHDGQRRSIAHVADLCGKSGHILAEGPMALLHRIVDTMVEHYQPEVDELEDGSTSSRRQVLESPSQSADERDPRRQARYHRPAADRRFRSATCSAASSRREFDLIGQEVAYRFRDVYDQLVRLADDAIIFQDRVTGILDAHLASVSIQLAQTSEGAHRGRDPVRAADRADRPVSA